MKLADSTGHVWHSGETNSFTMKPADWGFIKTISGFIGTLGILLGSYAI